MVRYKPLRVNSETLDQIDQLTQLRGCSARELLQSAILETWQQECGSSSEEAGIALIEDQPLPLVQPKTQYRQYVETITDQEGPYQVIRRSDSWAGHSDGVYKIDKCPVPVPVSWFDPATAQNSKRPLVVTTPIFFVGWLIVQIVLQIAFFTLVL